MRLVLIIVFVARGRQRPSTILDARTELGREIVIVRLADIVLCSSGGYESGSAIGGHWWLVIVTPTGRCLSKCLCFRSAL